MSASKTDVNSIMLSIIYYAKLISNSNFEVVEISLPIYIIAF